MGLVDTVTQKISDTATTATASVNKTIADASAVVSSTVNAVTAKADEIAKSAQNGLTNLSKTLSGDIAGKVQQAVGVAANSVSNIVNLGDIGKSVSAQTTKINIPVDPPFTNILHNYASYNYIFTLSIIPKDSLNFPETGYRNKRLGEIILKSGSINPSERSQTEYGKFEFFMDDVTLNTVITFNKGTGNSFSTTAKFTVTEVYSLGLFYQAMETAALRAGYSIWREAPFLLTVEFIGHINGDSQGVHADKLSLCTRYFPIKIGNVDMTVTNKGAVYNVETYAYSELAFSSVYNNLKTDISIAGSTVHEMLQTGKKSLQKVINDRLKNLAKRDGRDPDQILIYFPIDPASPPTQSDTADSATTSAAATPGTVEGRLKITPGPNETLVQAPIDMNPMGRASMEFDYTRPADQSVSEDNQVWDDAKKIYVRSLISVDPNNGEMRFAQNTTIVDVINQVIISSGYGRQALQPEQMKDGLIKWWKIEPQVYILSEQNNVTKTGTSAKLIVYRVISYGSDSSVILSPNADNPASKEIKKNVIKEYNYIYTSKNTDIVDFKIHFDNGFYKSTSADAMQNTASGDLASKKGNVNEGEQETASASDPGSTVKRGTDPTMSYNDSTSYSTGNKGGTGYDTPEITAARRVHDMLLNSYDLTNLDLTIVGDPYWIADSGIGNYIAQQTSLPNINADLAANTQTGDNTISINFRTPIDINMATGAYDFGPTKLVNRFSGVYVVSTVESKFSRGRFTQKLNGYRINGVTAYDGTVETSSGRPSLIVPAKAVPMTTGEEIVVLQDTAMEYGTDETSQQTQMLADQDAAFRDM